MSHFDQAVALVWSNIPTMLLLIGLALAIIVVVRTSVYELRRKLCKN